MNSKSVISFVRKMDKAELILAHNLIAMVKNLQSLENFFGKEEMAKKFSMTVRQWNSFKKGSNYSLREIATMNAAIMEQDIEVAQKENHVKFPNYKHSEKQ